jgi:hypothetical protein
VAHCTTSLQTPAPAIFKLHSTAQNFGCGCAKAIFPTTSKKAYMSVNSFHCPKPLRALLHAKFADAKISGKKRFIPAQLFGCCC